jgi:hypothetical protein
MGREQKPDAPEEPADAQQDARQRIDAVVLCIARLIGRQMAREDFERLAAVNDNQDGDLP